MMMLGVPRASGLMKAAKPKHRIGNKFEAHLKPLKVEFIGCCKEFTEDVELMLGKTEQQIGAEPRIRLSRARLAGAMERFRGDKHLEFTG
jgi:hypothetical protein